MFMIRPTYPSEEEQYNVFRRVVEAGGGFSVTVRALDVGGDKPLPYVDFGEEDNPFLGWRGIRFLLANPNYFEPHLRAILRTTVHGRVNVLLPMVANLDELLQAKEMLASAHQDLDKAGVPCSRNYHLGIMLEVPSALWSLPEMLPHIDFVSIGTNDLTQYTLAVDRGNSRVTRWFRQFHPVVLRMIKETCDIVASFPGKQVSLCGEIAGRLRGVPILVGLGLRYLSMNPWRIPQVREALGRVSLADCQALAKEVLACNLETEVMKLMDEFSGKHTLGE
jgi:phosphoenolpyruvate-protein kinase (PTS system EI component)